VGAGWCEMAGAMQDVDDTPFDRDETPCDGDEETRAIDARLARIDEQLTRLEASLRRLEASVERLVSTCRWWMFMQSVWATVMPAVLVWLVRVCR
jgi:hypothetical protein